MNEDPENGGGENSGNPEESTGNTGTGSGVELEDFSGTGARDSEDSDEPIQRTAQDLEAVFDVPVSISAVLGRTHMEVSELLRLESGDVIELDRKVGEAIDIYVNNRLIARGEVVLVDEKLGITMTEIIKSERH